MAIQRGRLHDPRSAPGPGEELFLELLTHRNLVVEQILSGESDRPVAYQQEQDEWVVVLDGAAAMTVDGEAVELRPGDWVFLPAGVPHTVERTEAGTSWLAVHLRRSDAS
jgi:cupin 2 domain-containing protein